MVPELKAIKFKNRIVFQKLRLPHFSNKLPKEYHGNEACFIFVNHGAFSVREPVQVIDLDNKTALLAKCINYLYESNELQRQSSEYIEVVGVLLYPDIASELFDFDITKSNHTVDYNLKQVEVNKLLEHYKESVMILIDHPELADEELIKNKLKEFIILITKLVNAPSELDFLSSMFKPNFAKFEEIIQQNSYANLSLEQLASLCHMSSATFKRKFKEVYNDSPIKYITSRKIHKAMELLKNVDLRISDIAYETGFDSITSFTRTFKKETGKSPSEYRLS
jgi:AraC family transcriptional regulator, exoenzyme S synthesis regulatory protein ExsA